MSCFDIYVSSMYVFEDDYFIFWGRFCSSFVYNVSLTSGMSVLSLHKIQELWSPVVYQVVSVPKEGGSVYSIAPVDDLDKVRQVHRSMLKVLIQKDFPVQVSTRSPVVESVPPLGDLQVLVSETPLAADVGVPVDPGHLGSSTAVAPAPRRQVSPFARTFA